MMTLVVLTVLIYGSFMPLVADWLLGPSEPVHRGGRILSQRRYSDKEQSDKKISHLSGIIEELEEE